MNEQNFDMYVIRFLLTTTIPLHKGKDRVQDAAIRAHRDVLAGRLWLSNYCESSKSDNTPVNKLCQYIKTTKLKQTGNVPIGSKELIDYLCKQFPSVEFGAIQKLVNMTLKYLLIISKYESSEELEDYLIDESKYDCPIDSIILGKLATKHTCWTSIQKEEYCEVQREIEKALQKEGFHTGNLAFDFINWNKR